ncbi:MAG: hypothetical protein ABSF54_20685, partial [Bryobacteraceae bacterium]
MINRRWVANPPHNGALAIDGAHQIVPALGEQGRGGLQGAPVERGGQGSLRLRLAGAGRTGLQMLFEA